MWDHITAYGGTHIIPYDAKPEQIHIRDIAHALSLTCRGNGHVKTFFSVGQHCLYCAGEAEARGYSARLILACLLHDAAECYLSDVPSPFKKHLPDYIACEERLMDMIYTKYLGSVPDPEEQKVIRSIDKALLYFDMRDLLGQPQEGPEPDLKISISYEVRPFAEVEEEYAECFRRNYARMCRERTDEKTYI